VLYKTSETVRVYVRGSDSNEELGTAALTNGEFSITITKKPATFSSANDSQNRIFRAWKIIKVEPADTQGAAIGLSVDSGGGIDKEDASFSGDSSSYSGSTTMSNICTWTKMAALPWKGMKNPEIMVRLPTIIKPSVLPSVLPRAGTPYILRIPGRSP
jgi:hypothetical protein